MDVSKVDCRAILIIIVMLGLSACGNRQQSVILESDELSPPTNIIERIESTSSDEPLILDEALSEVYDYLEALQECKDGIEQYCVKKEKLRAQNDDLSKLRIIEDPYPAVILHDVYMPSRDIRPDKLVWGIGATDDILDAEDLKLLHNRYVSYLEQNSHAASEPVNIFMKADPAGYFSDIDTYYTYGKCYNPKASFVRLKIVYENAWLEDLFGGRDMAYIYFCRYGEPARRLFRLE